MPRNIIEDLMTSIEEAHNEKWYSTTDDRAIPMAQIIQRGDSDVLISADSEGINFLGRPELTEAIGTFLGHNNKSKVKIAFNPETLNKETAFPDNSPFFSEILERFHDRMEVYSVEDKIDRTLVVVDGLNLFIDSPHGRDHRLAVSRLFDSKLAGNWATYIEKIAAKGTLLQPK